MLLAVRQLLSGRVNIHGDQLAGAIQRYLNRPYVSACDRYLAPFDAPEVPAVRQAERIKEGTLK